ncbi:MAG: DUF4167 domain-containing protein [Hyphomicrobiaceae bacterium]|nr:DUF4167 domain-containing protein [Hyphomicrobiaceae bacterium]
MRQGQQNRRGRGRNRKSQNPLTRSFESNGPDVKIRGTPAHIAEKYISLARDAQSSGDPVLAENYLQHAEHYNRIIMAFREQHMQQGGDVQSGMVRRPQTTGDFVDGEDYSDEDMDDGNVDPGQPYMGLNEPQPSIRGFEGGGRNEGGHQQEGGRQDQREPRARQERRGRGDFQVRPQRDRHQGHGGGNRHQDDHHNQNGAHRAHSERGQSERGQSERGQSERSQPDRAQPERHQPERGASDRTPAERPERADRGAPMGESPPRSRGDSAGGRRSEAPQRRRDQFAGGDEQPEFLRRPIRRPRREEVASDTAEAPAAAVNADDTVE